MKYLVVVLLSVCAILAGALTTHAQSVTTIYSFANTDGANPLDSLTLGPDGNFYGTTENGGASSPYHIWGTVFQVTTNGTLTTVTSFGGTNEFSGFNPVAGLTLGPDGNFYGTTGGGGASGLSLGTVFQVTTNGTLTLLASFYGTNGTHPNASLTLGPDGNFYGTTSGNFSSTTFGVTTSNAGAVFQVTTNGTLTALVLFNGTNGANPYAGLTLGPDGDFYGTTYGGGASNAGTVFQVTTNGALTTQVSFTGANGANPYGGLTPGPDGNFYGTTVSGGTSNAGTVFQLTTNGTLTTLASFAGTNGSNPSASLTLGPDGNFYGTTYNGGISNAGTMFKVTTNGSLRTLVSFGGANGANPYAGLTLGPDGNFYGTTARGGNPGGYGTIFRLNLPPEFIAAPTNQTVPIGSVATFNCQVFGTGPFKYQWYFGYLLDGATNSRLSFNTTAESGLGAYEVEVTNSYGSIVSKDALLTVLLRPNTYAISNSGGGNFTIYSGSFPGGTTNRLWATTNLALNQWQVIATNVTDVNGLIQFVDTNTAGVSQKFYRLSRP